MKICLLFVFLGLCAAASGQLMGGLSSIFGGGGSGGSGGLGGLGSLGSLLYPLMMVMTDPSSMSFPVMHMLMKNPTLMQNPIGIYMISSMLGVDVNKLAPMAMMQGGGLSGGIGGLLKWLPLLLGDPNAMSLMFSMGGMGGMGMGGTGMGMGPMGMLAAASAA